MTSHYNELPTWLAYPAALAMPSEGQVTVGKARDLVCAYLEYACLMLLSDSRERTEGYEPTLEAAMRYAMTREMGFEEWRTIYMALVSTPRGPEVLGLGHEDAFPAGHAVGRAFTAVTGTVQDAVTVGDLLGVIGPSMAPPAHTGPEIREAALSLLEASRILSAYGLCFVETVRTVEEDAYEVRYRPLVGTSFPETKVRRFWNPPPLTEGELCFWDLGKGSVSIAPWLAWYDHERLVVRMYGGRDAGTRQWLYPARNVASEPLRQQAIGDGAPVFLAEPTWQTPASPGPRMFGPNRKGGPAVLSPPLEAEPESNETQTLRRAEVEAAIQEVLSRGTAALSANVHPTLTDARKHVLRVIGGRSMLAYKELRPGGSIIIGRSPSHAEFVVHHPKVSRRNTRVWTDVQGQTWTKDLGSTNGTRLNGRPVGQEATRLNVLDVLQVGPALMRMEQSDPDTLGRIDRILAFPQDPERDPLTGLLKPKHLVSKLQLEGETFGTPGGPTGLVVYIDQLSGIHAKHGQGLADTVFLNVARLILFEMAEPSLCTRIGYGECLVVLNGESAGGALDVAQGIIEAVGDHAWVPTDLEVTVTLGVAEAQRGETVDDWISRAREAALRGRAQGGSNKVHRAPVDR